MKILGNIIWLIFGGLMVALEYFVSAVLLMITIIGIPFGLQVLKFGVLALWPFGSKVVDRPQSGGCLNVLMNVLWILLGGIWICISNIFWGALFCITIIGIPFGKQHFKLAHIALVPFGKNIV